jgi:transposase
MQHHIRPQIVLKDSATFDRFLAPLRSALSQITPLESRCNRPLTFQFEDEIKALVYYHVHHFDSANHLLQTLSQDTFARSEVVPPEGIAPSTFYEAIGSRGLPQLQQVFSLLASYASAVIPKAHSELGKLVVVDPTLIDCTLSMIFADYRVGSNKMQAHIGFDPHRSIPGGIVLTEGKADAHQHVETLVQSRETGILDRYFQCHADFDRWDSQGRFYVCRIKEGTGKHVVKKNPVTPGSSILSDEWVILGSSDETYTHTPVRLVVFRVGQKVYWIATNRFDLSAKQVAEVYRLRWAIEVFFGWWKRFMRVYHLISRSRYGLAVQLLSGLITYLLLALYCHEQFGEKVSIRRVRELQHTSRNESICLILFWVILYPLFLYKYATS